MTGPIVGISMEFILVAIGGYLIGSIPFGLVLTRLAGLGDIRDIGSGNIGATNVLRTGNIWLAALTLLLDGGKGFAVVYLVGRNWGFVGMFDAGLAAGFLTVVGHNFPVWLKFKGGKGVATTLGFLLGAFWPAGVVACAAWLLAAGVFRYSSLAALVALTAAPLYMVWTGTYPVAITAGALAFLSYYRHSANIERLLKGQEPKIGAPKD